MMAQAHRELRHLAGAQLGYSSSIRILHNARKTEFC